MSDDDRSRELRDAARLRILQTAVDHLHDLVFITEAEPREGGRRIVFVNRAFTELTGYEASEVLGKTPNITIGPATDRAVLRRIEAQLSAKLSVHEELLKYRKDGTCYWVELDIVPVWDDEGRTHWVSVQRDITERKARALRLVEAERRAAVGAVVGVVGRELGPGLGRVQSSLDRVTAEVARLSPERGAPEGELGERVVRIGAALERARADARSLERAVGEVTRSSLAREPQAQVEVVEVVDSAVGVVWRLLRHNARLERDLSPVGRVVGNADRLRQAVAHLLQNAVEAVRPGDLANNRVRLTTRLDARGAVVIEVADNGCGIPEPIRERVRLPFFTTKPIEAHEGLGVSFADEVARSMSGVLELESEVGKGTVVRLVLPAAPLRWRAPEVDPANDTAD